jgi:hypothetical protein
MGPIVFGKVAEHFFGADIAFHFGQQGIPIMTKIEFLIGLASVLFVDIIWETW